MFASTNTLAYFDKASIAKKTLLTLKDMNVSFTNMYQGQTL
jgi:hypothetical protein